MGYVYNDAQMLIAAQIAYLDVNYEGVSLGDVIDNILQWGYQDEKGNWQLYPKYQNYKNSAEMQRQLGTAGNIQAIAQQQSSLGDSWRNWKIVDTCDDNDRTGYYGCLIDTGDGNAIIGCRGSEAYDAAQFKRDWMKADFGLLDSELTKQQEKAQEYMAQVYREFGGSYDTFSVTGHSLGGNLAEHMVLSAPREMADKIDHCISFDGPGFSEEYIRAHRDLIKNASERMDHYQWSLVGSFLYPLPGVRDKVIAAKQDPNDLSTQFDRHDLINVMIDGNGNVQKGDRSTLAKYAGPFSRFLDHLGEGDGGAVDWVIQNSMKADSKILLSCLLNLVYGYKLIQDAYAKFKQVSAQISKAFSNLYYNYIAPKVSGNYEVVPAGLHAVREELVAVRRSLDAVTDELAAVQRNWKYLSGTGAYYRSRIFAEKCGLEADVLRLKALEKVMAEAINTYTYADRKVADSFA